MVEAPCNVSARGFWSAGQLAFLGKRVLNPSTSRYENQNLRKSYKSNVKDKNQAYNQRIQEAEHDTFTPLVMSPTDGMGRESMKFFAGLSKMVPDK